MEAAPAPQPGEPCLAGARPLRPVQRARLDAALQPAPPHRLRPADRRIEPLPPARLEDPGASGARLRAWRRDHHRAARPGHLQRGGHGARRAAPRRGVQPARSPDRRPLHLRFHGRRLHDGRHLARVLLARRDARPRQADRGLRRQRHLDRLGQGRDQAVVHRRRAQALRVLRLARHRAARRPRRRGAGPGAQARQARKEPSDPDSRQDDDRQGRAHQGQHRRRPRRRARRTGGGRDAPGYRLAVSGVRDSPARL